MDVTGNSLASLLLPYWPTAHVPDLEARVAQVRAHAASLRGAAVDVDDATRTIGVGNQGPAADAARQVLTGPEGHAAALRGAAAQADDLADGIQHYALSVQAIRVVVLTGMAAVVMATLLGPEAGIARLLAYQVQAKGLRNTAVRRLVELLGKTGERGGTIMKMGRSKDGWTGSAGRRAKSVANQVALHDQGVAARQAAELEKAAKAARSEQAARQKAAEAELRGTGRDN